MGGFMRKIKGALCCCRQDPSDSDSSATSPRPALPSEKGRPQDAGELTPFQLQARQIAQMPVAGMRRTTAPGAGASSSFVTTYQTVQNPRQHPAPPIGSARTDANNLPKTMPSQSTLSSNDTTMIGTAEHCAHDDKKLPANSTWQGKPKGTPYDRREELTEEDQDAWARMAM